MSDTTGSTQGSSTSQLESLPRELVPKEVMRTRFFDITISALFTTIARDEADVDTCESCIWSLARKLSLEYTQYDEGAGALSDASIELVLKTMGRSQGVSAFQESCISSLLVLVRARYTTLVIHGRHIPATFGMHDSSTSTQEAVLSKVPVL